MPIKVVMILTPFHLGNYLSLMSSRRGSIWSSQARAPLKLSRQHYSNYSCSNTFILTGLNVFPAENNEFSEYLSIREKYFKPLTRAETNY